MLGIPIKQEQKDPDNLASARQVVQAEKAFAQIQNLVRHGLAEEFENKDEGGRVIDRGVKLKDGTLLFYRNEEAIRRTQENSS